MRFARILLWAVLGASATLGLSYLGEDNIRAGEAATIFVVAAILLYILYPADGDIVPRGPGGTV